MIRFVIVLFCCSILCGCNNEEKKVTFYPEYDYGSYSVQYNDSLIRIFFSGKDDSTITLTKVIGMYHIKDSFYVGANKIQKKAVEAQSEFRKAKSGNKIDEDMERENAKTRAKAMERLQKTEE